LRRYRARADPGWRDSLHLSGEAKMIGLNIVLLALAGVAIWLSLTWCRTLRGQAGRRKPTLATERLIRV